MPPITPIRTTRLILREYTPTDLPAFFALFSDPLVQRYEGEPVTEDQARTRMDEVFKSIDANPRTEYRLAITLPPSDDMIGVISLRLNSANIHEWEMGWAVSPRCWGQGIATEAARALVTFAFEQLDANRVLAICHAGNAASARVMEKIGMRREGRMRETRWLNGEKFDELVYAILKSD